MELICLALAQSLEYITLIANTIISTRFHNNIHLFMLGEFYSLRMFMKSYDTFQPVAQVLSETRWNDERAKSGQMVVRNDIIFRVQELLVICKLIEMRRDVETRLLAGSLNHRLYQ